MPGGSTLQRGNQLFSQILFLTVTPSATVTTATQTAQVVSVPGVQPGDVLVPNLTTPVAGATYNALLSLNSAFVSSLNNVTISWTTEGATISGAGAQTVLLKVTRPENAVDGGVTTLPNSIF